MPTLSTKSRARQSKVVLLKTLSYALISVLVLVGSPRLYFLSRSYLNENKQSSLETTATNKSTHNPELPPCKPINITSAKEKIICLPKCKPQAGQTIEGMQLDHNEMINVTTQQNKKFFTGEYGKYRIHFSEENIHLDVINPQKRGQEMAPRSVTERLFRRIIAKLFRAGVLDPSKNIINTGSWIGDNALPWAIMLEQLSDNPGKVIAVDPSQIMVQAMASIANTNSISNLCTRVAVYSSEERTIFTGTTEHMIVNTVNKKGIELKAITLDSEGLNNVTLMHLDVEGHEAELLMGARGLIESSRPVIVTEGVEGLKDVNDRKVATLLNLLGYERSSEIPEVCGWLLSCRNHIWWPDNETEAAAMQVIRKDLSRPVVSWLAFDLPE